MCGVPLGGWSFISWSSLYRRLYFIVPLRLREGRIERFDKEHFKNGKQCDSVVAVVVDADSISLALSGWWRYLQLWDCWVGAVLTT